MKSCTQREVNLAEKREKFGLLVDKLEVSERVSCGADPMKETDIITQRRSGGHRTRMWRTS